MAQKHIWKVQRPINRPGPLLIYRKGRKSQATFWHQTELGYHDVLSAMGEDIKSYFPGTVKDGKLYLDLALKLKDHPLW